MSMNDSVSSPIINGSTDPEYHQKLLTMMEANGQYPINIDQSVMDSANTLPNHGPNGTMNHNPFTNGNLHHSKLLNSEMHHTTNGFVQHSFASNGNAEHMNGNIGHPMNGHAPLEMNGHVALEMNGSMEYSQPMNGNTEHSVNGHVNSAVELPMDGDMHMDHTDHSLVNQAPQRCMMLCGHFQ